MSDDDQVTALLTRVAERGGAAAGATPPPVSVFVSRARRRRVVQRLSLAAGGAVLVILLAAAAVAVVGHSPRVRTGPATGAPVTPPPASLGVAASVFGVATGDVLVFDDGYDGVAAIDLDHRTVSRREVFGQISGDQPWRLTTSGSDLIVGWGQVYAAPLAGGPSKLLGAATFSLPAAEPGRVWLVSYSGGAIGEGTLSVRQVTTGGRTVIPGRTPNPALGLGVPLFGVPGGLAFPTSHGLALWDAATGRVTQTLGSPDPSQDFQVGLPSGDHLAWCAGACSVLHVTTLSHGDDVVSPFTGSSGFDVATARFSPDGRYLAVVADGPGADGSGGSVVLVDTATGAAQIAVRNASSLSSVAWGTDDTQLFFSSVAPSDLQVIVGLFDMGNGSIRTAAVPAEVESTFVVLPTAEARSFLATNLGPLEACRTPTVEPSNRITTCGYRF